MGIRYCRADVGRLAFSVTGSGPVVLVEPGWVTHLQAQLETASFGAFMSALAQRFTVVRFDKPGCGLSDREGQRGGFAGQVAAALAVLDAVPARRFSVLGASQGGQVAVALAAAHPDRVESLVLFGTCADGADLAPPNVRDALLQLVSAHWGLGSTLLTEMFVPAADAAFSEAFTRLQRAAASAEVARELLELYYSTDVTELLPLVRARTLVLHRQEDVATRFDLGRRLAAAIPDALLVPLPGPEHLFYTGDWTPALDAMMAFLLPEPASSARLTPRELAVSRLVTEGLTNHAIGSRLGIADRTVDSHVENVRRKLAVRSRAQIAAWITEHDRPSPA